MDINETFPLKLMINLSRREDRRFRMDYEFLKLGLEVRRVAAINAKYVRNPRGYTTPAKHACALSHRLALREARSKGAEACLVFQDDVVFHPEFEKRMRELQLPDDWGMFYLGCLHLETPEPVAPGLVRVKKALDMHAMAVRAPFYQTISRHLRGEGKAEGEKRADVLVSELHSSIPTYAAWPNLAWQQEGHSDLAEMIYSNYHEDGTQRFFPETEKALRAAVGRVIRQGSSSGRQWERVTQRYRSQALFTSYSIGGDDYEFLSAFSRLNEVRQVLEIGPGASTWAFLEAGCEVLTCETDNEFLAEAKSRFASQEKITVLPAKPCPGLGLEWMRWSGALAFVDGPYEPGLDESAPARLDACKFASERAKMVILHDACRSGEQRTQAWFQDQGWSCRLIPTAKGLFVFWKEGVPRFPEGF